MQKLIAVASLSAALLCGLHAAPALAETTDTSAVNAPAVTTETTATSENTSPAAPENCQPTSPAAPTTTPTTTPEGPTTTPGNLGGDASGSRSTTTTEEESSLPSTGEATGAVLVLAGVVILSGTVVMKRKFTK